MIKIVFELSDPGGYSYLSVKLFRSKGKHFCALLLHFRYFTQLAQGHVKFRPIFCTLFKYIDHQETHKMMKIWSFNNKVKWASYNSTNYRLYHNNYNNYNQQSYTVN